MPQALGLDLTFKNENGQFFTKRVQHIYGSFGFYKFVGDDGFIEPSVLFKYVPNAPLNVDVNLRYQIPGSLWIGAGASSAKAIHLETGFLLGAILISTVKDYFPRRVLLQPQDGLALATVVMIVCLISSGLGVRLALRVDPAKALGG